MAGKRTVTSIKGERVDFDLLKIKNQIVQSPKTNDVVAREKFIDKRRRRTNRIAGTDRKTNQMLAEQAQSKAQAQEAIRQQAEIHNNKVSEQPVDNTPPAQHELDLSPPATTGENTNNNFQRKIIT
jgi:hypothetical protein